LTTELKTVQRFFDSYWKQEGMRRFDSTSSFAKSATIKAWSLMECDREKKILEIGCGEGRDLLRLCGSGAQVVGIDLSRTGLSVAKDLSPQTNLLIMDGADLGFADSAFDTVFSRTLLMHVRKKALLRECRRVLRPGGKAVFIEPLRSNPLLIPYRAAISSGRRVAPQYLTIPDLDHIRTVFRSVRIWHFYLLSVIGAPLASLMPRARLLFLPLEWLDRLLLSIFPFLKNFCWISVIECTR
jgi:SAM-dependent methyltransferase